MMCFYSVDVTISVTFDLLHSERWQASFLVKNPTRIPIIFV